MTDMDNQLSFPGYLYPEMEEAEQRSAAAALLGLAMEEPVLYMPSFSILAVDMYAGLFLSWFIKQCRYGQSIVLEDADIQTLFGYSKSRWHGIRRNLKQLDYLLSRRENGETLYSLNETCFSDAQKRINHAAPAVPVDLVTAAAMLGSGLRIQDVLFYAAIREQQPYLPPEQRDRYSDWFEHTANRQQQLQSLLTVEEQHKAIHALYRSGIMQVTQLRGSDASVRYRINYDTVADLGWQYIHTAEADGKEGGNER